MTRFSMAFVAAVALAALSGCLGGGGGGSTAAPAAQMPREPAPAPTPEPAADPEPEPMAGPAPAPEPARAQIGADDLWGRGGPNLYYRMFFWTVGFSQQPAGSTRIAEVSGYEAVSSTVSVLPLQDGSGVRVRRTDPYGRVSAEPSSGRAGPDITVFESSGGPVSEVGQDAAIFGRVAWDDGDDDAGRWVSWGWWLEWRGADFVANAPSAWSRGSPNFGAFADGWEFQRNVPELPTTGTARYRGPTAGVFTSGFGGSEDAPTGHGHGPTDFNLSGQIGNGVAGSLYTGEFTGSVDWIMTYTGADANAHDARLLGDVRIGRLDGVVTDRATGARRSQVIEYSATEPGPAWRLAGWVGNLRGPLEDPEDYGNIYSTSENEGGRRVAPALISGSGFGPGATGSGNWHGRLSSVTSGGHPRSMIGIYNLEANTENSEHHFSGAFLAPLVE